MLLGFDEIGCLRRCGYFVVFPLFDCVGLVGCFVCLFAVSLGALVCIVGCCVGYFVFAVFCYCLVVLWCCAWPTVWIAS